MRTIKLTIEYDGTDFVGWQRQPEGVSVQGLLEDALAAFEGAPVAVHGAGRTDAGVHALGQVASFTLAASHPATTLQRALNAVLPPTVRILDVADVASDFHARFSAVGKSYEYRLANTPFVSPFIQRYVWHVPGRLDRAAMVDSAAALVGTHDFAAFQASGSMVGSTTRTVLHLDWEWSDGSRCPSVMRIEGDGFLRHMVRNIVGTLVEAGAGRIPPGRIREILTSRERGQAGRTAPASGLFLVSVRYPATREKRKSGGAG